MKRKKNRMSKEPLATLKDRRSVRTTFKLSQKAIDEIVLLAKFNGVRQKDVIDTCVSLLCDDYNKNEKEKKSSSKWAGRSTSKQNSDLSVRKTYVISRRSLNILKEMSKDYDISRNKLLESAVRRLKKLRESKLEELKKGHEEIKNFIDDLLERTARLEKLLNHENPVINMFHYMTSMANDTEYSLYSHIYEESPLEWFYGFYDWRDFGDTKKIIETFNRKKKIGE